MEKPHRHPRGNWRNLVLAGVFLLVVAADQFTKWWIINWWNTTQSPDGVLWDGGFVRIIYLQNTGAAFGIFQGFNLVFVVFYFIVLIVIAYAIFRYHGHPYIANNIPARIIAGLILGGMTGNLVDRIRFGRVTDFIDFKVWPAFNVADSALTLSIVLICVYIICYWAREPRRQP
jgi:signal peptidase II